MEFVCPELAIEDIIKQPDKEAGLELVGSALVIGSPRSPEYAQKRQPDLRGDKEDKGLETNPL